MRWFLSMLALVPTVTAAAESRPVVDSFDAWLAADQPVADGFDFPVGDKDARGSYTDGKTARKHHGWYIAAGFLRPYALGIHTGDDWNGKGGGDTDLGQPVHAVAAGRVVEAGEQPDPFGGVVVIEHLYYENHHKRRVRSVYVHLSRVDVRAGDVVTRRHQIGAIGKDPAGTYPAHLHLELRTDFTLDSTFWPSSSGWDGERIRKAYVDPDAFIRSHRSLFVPQHERVLVLVDRGTHRLRLYENGKKVLERGVAFGQVDGVKEVLGDSKSPAGMYFVVDMSTGPFTGDYADFYGGHWIKVNYPNAFDAQRGLSEGIIDEKTRNSITRRWAARQLTSQKTRLGGGIGFHGWIAPWDAGPGGANLSWGCVVLQPAEISELYERVSAGTMVVMF